MFHRTIARRPWFWPRWGHIDEQDRIDAHQFAYQHVDTGPARAMICDGCTQAMPAFNGSVRKDGDPLFLQPQNDFSIDALADFRFVSAEVYRAVTQAVSS